MSSLLEHEALVEVPRGNKTQNATGNTINQGMALSIGAGTVGVMLGGPIGGLLGTMIGAALIGAVKVAHAVRK